VEVEAAAHSGAVQRFAHKVEAGAALELKTGFQLCQAQTAAGGLGLFPSAGGQPLEEPVLCGVGQHLPRGIGQGVQGLVRQMGCGPERLAQLRVQQPRPEIGGGLAGQQGHPPREQGRQGRFVQRGEEVQLHGRALGPALGGQQTGKLHDADAGQAVFGELYLARLGGKGGVPVEVQQGGCGLGPDARKGSVRFCHLQGGQAGVERLQFPTALGGELGAEAVGAELRACIAAQRADDGIGVEGLVTVLGAVEEDGVTVPVLADGIYGAAGPHLYAEAGHLPFQQGQHIGGLIRVRVDPPGLVGAGVKAQRPEPLQRGAPLHRRQQRGQRLRVGGEIALRRDAGVVEVAAAVAGCQQLFAAAGVAVQQGDAGRAARSLCRRQRGCHTRSTAA